jgi:hypothetical protein
MMKDLSLIHRAAKVVVLFTAIGLTCNAGRAAQNANPPELVRPKPPAIPGDFQDQRPVSRGPKVPRFDPVQAHKDASQLSSLAKKIPSQEDQVSKDQLPKDLLQNLKQIQKLAKRLRSEIPH